MPVYVASIFSALIIFITVSSIIKVLMIAHKRKEIHFRQLIVYASTAVAVGGMIAISLPLAFEKVFQWVLSA